MWKYASLLLLPFLLLSQELEVRLPTRSNLQPTYLSRFHTDPSQYDWRYIEELRSTLEFDLNTNGFTTVMDRIDALEETLQFPEVRAGFDLSAWKKEKVCYAVAVQVVDHQLQATVFNIEKGTSKKYPVASLTGRAEEDRKPIHQLADTMAKDLFSSEGIASLRLIYSLRTRDLEADDLSWFSEICTCDSDGANARQLTFEKNYCVSPFFLPESTPDNPQFYYVSFKLGQSKIYRASFARPEGEIMVTLRGNQALPNLNSRGTQIAFITDVAGRPDLFVQNFDLNGRMLGKARQLFSAPRATQASPTFSPDGKRLAFVSDKDGPPRIYLMDVLSAKETKQPKPTLLTKRNRENTSPSWSPDGKKLAYSAKVDGVRQIWTYDFSTEEETQLTTGPENKENPSWAPDSLHLVYNTESDDICELYLMNWKNPNPVLISKGPGQKRFASWEMR
jgi:TolB protein